jgi:hypothetical protein
MIEKAARRCDQDIDAAVDFAVLLVHANATD